MSEPANPNDAPIDSALAALEPGFLVGNGRFTLVRLIGRGGMGVVWLARDESLREEVALKFLPPEIRFDAVALDDLRRETARSRKLTHPNIIRIHDIFKDEREAFISMEFVDGPNLSDLRLAQPERVFTWSYLEPLVKQLCEALDYAHNEKVIHRDLKPANMMLDSRGRLKLSDFGIAAQISDSATRVSVIRHGQSGTVTYMSPQQMDGKLPQVSDDIYAFGATLYELLTSKPPFFTGDIAHQVRNFIPQPIDERLAELGIENDVPPAVAALVMACLGKSPDQRPPSARAMAEWIGFQPVTQTTAPSAIVPSTAVESEEPPRIESKPSPATTRASAPRQKTDAPTPPPVVHAVETEEEHTDFAEAVPHEAPRREWNWPLLAGALTAVVLAGVGVGVLVWWTFMHAGSGKNSSPNPAQLSASEFLKTEHVITGHHGGVSSVTFSPDQHFLISGSADGTVRVYETTRGELQWSANADVGAVNSVSVSRDSKFLATAGANGLIRVFTLSSGAVFQTLRLHTTPVSSVVFSPTAALLASADESGNIALWNYETGGVAKQWNGHNAAIFSLAFSHGGVWLASGSQDLSVRVWNVSDGALIKSLPGHRGLVWALAFSPDGSMMLSGSRDRSARIWSTKSFGMMKNVNFRSDANLMRGLAFSPDSKFFAGGAPRTVKVFNIETAARGKERVIKATGIVRAVTFSPDGRALVAGSEDGLVHIWPFNGEALFGLPAPALIDEEASDSTNEVRPMASASLENTWMTLFNGTDLSGWSGDSAVWSVRNGVIHGYFAKKNSTEPSGLFWRGGTVEDFELQFSFRLINGNAGVYYRAVELPNFSIGGYQYDILPRPGNLLDTGSDRVRRVLFRSPGSMTPVTAGEWHTGAINARGGRIQHSFDGRVLTDVIDSYAKRPQSGLLVLEATGGPTEVEFKDIRLKRTSGVAAAANPAPASNAWIPLFAPGEGLTAWTAAPGEFTSVWKANADGSVTGAGGKSHLFTKASFTNLEFKAEVKLSPGANSGMYFHARPALPYPEGYEAQLYNGGGKEDRKTGSLYGIQDTKERWVSDNTWFTQQVVVVGKRIIIQVNGRVTADYEAFETPYPSGQLALQQLTPAAAIHFRNVMVKALPDDRSLAWDEVVRDNSDLAVRRR
jgi:WD40 repeat protein